MARTEARIFSSVWTSPEQCDFRALPDGAQWLYWVLLSQPELSMCGVLTEAAERWSRLATGVTAKTVRARLARLSADRFVVHDASTSEVWVRAYLRRDGVLAAPNFIVAMARAFGEVHSTVIREGIVAEIHRQAGGRCPEDVIREQFPKAFPEGFRDRLPEAFRDAVHGPCTHACAITTSPCHHVTLSPQSPSSTSRQPTGSTGATDKSANGDGTKRTRNPKAAMLTSRLAEHTEGTMKPGRLEYLVDWILGTLDYRTADAILGGVIERNGRPHSDAYWAKAYTEQAAALGITMPPYRPGRAA